MNAPIFLAIFLGLPVNWFSTGPIGQKAKAELQYTSWWDGSGMKFEMGGMDPTCRHPKPRPYHIS